MHKTHVIPFYCIQPKNYQINRLIGEEIECAEILRTMKLKNKNGNSLWDVHVRNAFASLFADIGNERNKNEE